MAIVGVFSKIKAQLKKKSQLIHVFDYLDSALDESNEVHKRILSNSEPSFLLVDLDDGCVALEQVFYTKSRADCFFESHKKYIDFQLLLSGQEQMELIDKDKLEFEKYDEYKDFIFYGNTDEATKLVMNKEDLAIFFPDDAHMGLPLFKEKQLVYKTVVKVPVELFDGL